MSPIASLASTGWLPGSPPEVLLRVLDALPGGIDVAVVRDGDAWVVAVDPDDVMTVRGADAFPALDALGRGWWAGFVGYDLGRAVERIRPQRPTDPTLPDVALARFDARLVIDEHGARVEGKGRTGRRLTRLLAGTAGPLTGASVTLGPWTSDLSRPEFEAGVRAAVNLIEAGECYQVNLTRRLTTPVTADPVALFAALARHNPSPHAALVRLGDTSVVSASPELFLRRRGNQVETRPIKGTAADAAVLAASAKDRAENVMIVDLARNDLGRVCEFGSVAVPALCVVEPHPGLHHLVSTVTGTLRPGVGAGALLHATFPPASVTGAPKPRVLQAIEELEASPRGVYCGAVGWIDVDQEALDLNVAIRTFVTGPGGTELGVGAGIVADSDPAAEWRETELKVARLLSATRR
ncbi:MAG: anthranilate synthase component I family protein [Acidimicrobiia bacterium]